MGDVAAAARWLQTQPEIAPARISLIGWSNGAIAVMNAIDDVHPLVTNVTAYHSAIARYPDCRRHINDGWRTGIPLLILIGADDDWVGAPPCVALAKQAHAAGDAVRIIVYPGAVHDFDWPSMALRTRTGMGFSYSRTGVVHVGTNPAARDDAWRRIAAFLADG